MTLVPATSFNPCPKPFGRLDQDERLLAKVNRLIERKKHRKPLKRTPIARSTKPIVRSPLARSTKRIPQVNVRAQSRRRAKYRRIIASDFHKWLRYQAFVRSGGLCECAECKMWRSGGPSAQGKTTDSTERLALAFTEIPCWFTKKGGEPWRRFRSTDGETHHTGYGLFGQENPAELELVQFTWKSCHRRIEAEHHTRRNFLSGRTAR